MIYMSEAIHQLLKEQAHKRGLTVSAYVRYLIVMEKVRELEQKGEFDSEE